MHLKGGKAFSGNARVLRPQEPPSCGILTPKKGERISSILKREFKKWKEKKFYNWVCVACHIKKKGGGSVNNG